MPVSPPPPVARQSIWSTETTAMLAMLVFGCVAMAVIWGLEYATGVIARWDLWTYPTLIALFAGAIAVLVLRPAWTDAAKVVVLGTINLYLVTSVHLTLFAGTGALDTYKMSTAMFWLPMCYSGVFVLLSLRAALIGSALTFAATFLPIGTAYLVGAPARWGEGFATLAVNLALAQTGYVVMLSAIAILRTDHSRVQRQAEVMRTLASTDALTQVPNRRALTETLAGHLALAERGAQSLSVILIDVDHFKRINDRYGHAAGDAALVLLARLLKNDLRASDLLGRWGGEEFLVVAPAMTMVSVIEVAERLRAMVAAWPFDHGEPVSISLGVAQALPGDTIDTLVQRADNALYRAKERGRNRVEAQALAVAS